MLVVAFIKFTNRHRWTIGFDKGYVVWISSGVGAKAGAEARPGPDPNRCLNMFE